MVKKVSRKKSLEKLKNSKKRKKRIKLFGVVILVFIFVFNIETVKTQKKYANSEVYSTENIKVNPEQEIKNETTISQLDINNEEETTKKEDTLESKENTKVKEIIDEYRKNNNLNEGNFAFFYYRPDTEEYYIYNEDTFFTAASTIKVPIAMIYYDKIYNNDLTKDSTFKYKSSHYEAGAGNTASQYKPGNEIKLSFLLEQMIVESDNTATNILKDNLGGEKAYRILIKQYTSKDFPEEFNIDNLTSAGFGLDIIKKIYSNQEKYSELIELMKKSSGGGYLKKDVSCEVAHKYGSFEGYVHDYGICYADTPYIIGVFTKDVDDAENLIAQINKKIMELK